MARNRIVLTYQSVLDHRWTAITLDPPIVYVFLRPSKLAPFAGSAGPVVGDRFVVDQCESDPTRVQIEGLEL